MLVVRIMAPVGCTAAWAQIPLTASAGDTAARASRPIIIFRGAEFPGAPRPREWAEGQSWATVSRGYGANLTRDPKSFPSEAYFDGLRALGVDPVGFYVTGDRDSRVQSYEDFLRYYSRLSELFRMSADSGVQPMLTVRFFGGNKFGAAREGFSWWDDGYWAGVSAFQGALSRFVRENGGAGLSFDTEVYWGLNPGRLSAWTDTQGRSREELKQAIQRRAAELSDAIYRECPECIISFYGLGGPDLDLGLGFYDGFLTHHFPRGVHWELYLYWFRRGYAWQGAYQQYLDRTLREFTLRHPEHRDYVQHQCTLYAGLPAAYDRYYDARIAVKAQQKRPPAVPWALITAAEYAQAISEIARFAPTLLIYPATLDYVYPGAAWEFRKQETALKQIFDGAAYQRRAEAIAEAFRRLKGAGGAAASPRLR